MEIVKIGGVELTPQEAEKYYFEGKYIVTRTRIYQLFYSNAQKRVYGQSIYHSDGMTKRGRFFAMSGRDVNHLIGFKLVNEEREAAR